MGHHLSPILKGAGINLASHLQSKDLHLSLTLLQNRPSSYLAQRVDSLPHDMRARVKSYIADRQAEKAAATKDEEVERQRHQTGDSTPGWAPQWMQELPQ